MRIRFFSLKAILCTAFALFSLTLSAAHAQCEIKTGHTQITRSQDLAKAGAPSSAIAAVVEGCPITTRDVDQRVRLMMLSSGGRLAPEMAEQLKSQALRDLVEETLKLIEASSYEMQMSEREVNQEIAGIAGQSGMTPQQFEEVLASQGVAIESMRSQIRANILWPQLVRGRFGSNIRVSDNEVQRTYERMRDDATKEQFLVSEICIPVADPNQARAYYEGGLQLIEQMRRGVPFAVVAQQFSACPSAAAGGDIGWVRAGELAPEINDALKVLPAGAVTNPIPSEGAFMIMAVRDKRNAVVKGKETFTLAYAGAPIAIGRSAARRALEKLPAAQACGVREQRQDLGDGVGLAFLENVTIEDIDERFQGSIEGLGRGEMSAIIEADDALHAVYVCDKDEGLGLPSRDALKDRIFRRHLTRRSQQYLRDVERQRLVDIRRDVIGGPITGPSAGAGAPVTQ